ncbi:MAG: transketolase [archaeon]
MGNIDKNTIDLLKEIAKDIRRRTLTSIYTAGSGHYGSSLSWSEIASTLFFHEMKLNAKSSRARFACPPVEISNSLERDVFILSKGHGVPTLYSVISILNPKYISRENILTLRKMGSPLQGHPVRNLLPLIDASTGSLGQGLSIGAGIAYAIKQKGEDRRVYVLLGDGEIQEGQNWEAFMSSANLRLENLTIIVDKNNCQLEGPIGGKMPLENLPNILDCFGFYVQCVDGHNVPQILDSYENARQTSLRTGRPSFIIANTVKGKGVSLMEREPWKWHSKLMDVDDYLVAMRELE